MKPRLLDSAFTRLYCCLQPDLPSGYYDVRGVRCTETVVSKPKPTRQRSEQSLLLAAASPAIWLLGCKWFQCTEIWKV
jgi:hypothetical protein